jgi:hypothetical protein
LGAGNFGSDFMVLLFETLSVMLSDGEIASARAPG